MLLDDLIDDPLTARADDTGWSRLMKLAAEFPLETLSFGRLTPANSAPAAAAPQPAAAFVPRPREVSYDRANALVDGAGDGPSIGLGVGMSLAGR